jgi:hypothetical protein
VNDIVLREEMTAIEERMKGYVNMEDLIAHKELIAPMVD